MMTLYIKLQALCLNVSPLNNMLLITTFINLFSISTEVDENTRVAKCVSFYKYQGCSCVPTCSPPPHLLLHTLGHTPSQVSPSFFSHTLGCKDKTQSAFSITTPCDRCCPRLSSCEYLDGGEAILQVVTQTQTQ